MGPTPALVLPYFTISSLVAQWDLPPLWFLPSGTVGPTPAKLLPCMQFHPWWHSGNHSCPSSSLLHDFFPSGTVGPTSSPVSSLVVQWDPPLPNFFPACNFIHGGTVGTTPAKLLPCMQFHPWWHSGTHFCPSSSLLHVAQWDLPPLWFLPSGTVGPTPAKLLPCMQFHPWWHSGNHSCPSSSLLHDFFPSGTVRPTFSPVPP